MSDIHKWNHPVTLELLERQWDPTYGDGEPLPITVAVCPVCSCLVHHLDIHRAAVHADTYVGHSHEPL